MSDTVWVAMITGGVGVAGIALNVYTQSQERKQRRIEKSEDNREWYGRALFERRLVALSEEYAWLMKMNRVHAALDDKDPISIETANDCSHKACEWYDANAFYLYDTHPQSSDFIGTANSVNHPASNFHQQLNDALKSNRTRTENLTAAWHHDH